jgi:hypothetical protein
MRPGRRVLARVAVVALLAGLLQAVVPGPAHAGSLTPRSCRDVITGDRVRMLSVCARGWVSENAIYTRSVIEMHTYRQGAMGQWIDSRSQSITMNEAASDRDGSIVAIWGQDQTQKCRINGSGGTVGCSVPNVVRVAYYGPQLYAPNFNTWATIVWHVTWRDDRGVAHNVDWYQNPLISPEWSA